MNDLDGSAYLTVKFDWSGPVHAKISYVLPTH